MTLVSCFLPLLSQDSWEKRPVSRTASPLRREWLRLAASWPHALAVNQIVSALFQPCSVR